MDVKLGVATAAAAAAATATCGRCPSVAWRRYSAPRKFDCRRPGWLEFVFGPSRIRPSPATARVSVFDQRSTHTHYTLSHSRELLSLRVSVIAVSFVNCIVFCLVEFAEATPQFLTNYS